MKVKNCFDLILQIEKGRTLACIFGVIGDFMHWTFNLVQADAIGDMFNYAVILL